MLLGDKTRYVKEALQATESSSFLIPLCVLLSVLGGIVVLPMSRQSARLTCDRDRVNGAS